VSRNGNVAVPPFLFGSSDGTNYTFSASSNGSTFNMASGVLGGTIDIGTWTHIAVGRSGNTLYTFKNGTLVTSQFISGSILDTTANLFFGFNNGTYLDGYLDDFFMLKGLCLHTASFTAPTEPRNLTEGAYYFFNSAEDFTGDDLDDALSASVVYGTEGGTITLENTGTVTGYAKVSIYAFGIYSDSSIETRVTDETSIAENGDQNLNLEQPYQQETTLAFLEGRKIIELEKNGRTVLNEIEFCANKSETLMKYFLFFDVGDLVNVTITADGVDSYYYIQAVKVKSDNTLTWVRWKLKQAWTLAKGYTHVACEFAGSTENRIGFEYLPIVSSDAVTNRGWSAWVWLDAITNSYDQTIIGAYSGDSGTRLYIDNHATNVVIAFDSARFATAGKWSNVDADALSGQWGHVFLAYDHSSAANNPTVYINGAALALTENTTPSGDAVSEEGNALVIGNNYTGGAGWNGKIKDARVYDMTGLDAATLADALYNEGAGGTANLDGMVFQAFVVRSDEESDFEDLTLTTESLLDSYLGYVGTPSGSPIVRLIV